MSDTIDTPDLCGFKWDERDNASGSTVQRTCSLPKGHTDPIDHNDFRGDGASDGKRRCVVVLDSQYVEGRGFVPSMVVEGEAGHHPLVGNGELSEPWYWGHDIDKARKIAADFNARLGISEEDADAIFGSSIAASFRQDAAQARVDQKLGR